VAYKKVKYVFDPIGDLKIVNKQAVLEEISDLIKDEILAHVGDGDSPVKGEGKFKKLDPKYAKKEKFGDPNPNLDLTGAMLDNLVVRPIKGKIEVFVEGSSNLMRGKVEGHNQHDSSLTPRIEKRRFIPAESQTFKPAIMRTIKDILQENIEPEEIGGVTRRPTAARTESARITRSVQDALDDFGFTEFFEDNE